MVVLWMCYATLVTALLVAGAWAADGALGALGWPRRWGWAVAVAGGLGLPAWGAWARARPAPTPPVRYVITGPSLGVPNGNRSAPVRATWRLDTVPPPTTVARARLDRATGAVWVAAARALTPFDRAALGLWVLASLGGVACVARGAWTVRRGQRGWRPALVAGERVWLAPNLGPALVGAVRPRVVLPAWLLDTLDVDGLRLVLAHERAHAVARDPLLLACALGALIMAPWNAPLWLAARRLRLAAEADCDRRVLRAYPGARRYARLLIDMAERALGGPGTRGAMATALLDPPGLLERRVEWLLGTEGAVANRARVPRVVVAALGAVGVVALACAVPRPTAVTPVLASRASVRFSASAACSDSATCVGARLEVARRAQTVIAREAATSDTEAVRAGAFADRMDVASAHLDSAARRLDEDARRINAAARARVRAEEDSVGRAQRAGLAHTRAVVDFVGRAEQAAFSRARAPYASLPPARDTRNLSQPYVQLRVDSLFERLRAAAGPLARDPRAKARFDSTVDALRAEVTRLPRSAVRPTGSSVIPGIAADPEGGPDRTAVRALVAREFPGALTGALGHRPFVWLAFDVRGNVARSAVSPDRLTVLDREAIRRQFPELTDAQVGSYTWMNVPAGRDTVNLLVVSSPVPR